MRIVHVVESIDPSYGGPAVSVPSLAAAQSSLGHDVEIVYYGSKDTRNFKSNNCIPNYSNVKKHQIPPGGILEAIFAKRASKVLTPLIRAADIVHVHGVWSMMLLNAIRTSIREGIRFVVAPRGMLDPWSLRQKKAKKIIMWYAFWKRCLDKAFFLHALNYSEATLMAPLSLVCPIKVIPNGLFSEQIDVKLDSVYRPAAIERLEGKPYVLFLGRLHYKKGLDLLLDAFSIVARENSEIQLLVAGPDEGALKTVEKKIEEHELTSRVCIAGSLHGAEKFLALSRASCFCLPSRQEGFSMAILEALGSGIPVVISKECHFPEVTDAGAGAEVELDAKDIARAILLFVNDLQSSKRAGENGRNLVKTQFTWQNIARDAIIQYSK